MKYTKIGLSHPILQYLSKNKLDITEIVLHTFVLCTCRHTSNLCCNIPIMPIFVNPNLGFECIFL